MVPTNIWLSCMEQQTYLLEVQKLHLMIQCHTGTCQKVPHGEPQNTSLVLFVVQSTKACNINCQSTIPVSKVHFGQGLHWCYALCVTWGSLGNFLATSSVSTWRRVGCQGGHRRSGVKTLWVKLKTWYKFVKPKSQIHTFDCDQVQTGRWNSSIFQCKSNRDKALGTIWCIAGPRAI